MKSLYLLENDIIISAYLRYEIVLFNIRYNNSFDISLDHDQNNIK